MNTCRFICFGDMIIALHHIIWARRYNDGNVDLWLLDREGDSIRLYASEAEAFWAWLTTSPDTTTLQLPQRVQDTGEKHTHS
jgi:hypothetical protein